MQLQEIMKTAIKENNITTVDGYIKSFSKEMRVALNHLRKSIRAAAPGAEESISYRIPTYKWKGSPLVYFGGFIHHASIFLLDKNLLEEFRDELKKQEISGTTIKFHPQHLPPAFLIKKMVKARINQTEARLEAKKKKNEKR